MGVVDTIMEGIMGGARMKSPAPDGYACLVNSLGNVPPQETSIVVADLMRSKWAGDIKLLVGPAPLCTSLDMNGVSISLLRLTPAFDALLKAETSVHAAWPPVVKPERPTPAFGIVGLDPFKSVSWSGNVFVEEIMEKICKKLIESKKILDELDAKVGDADCGSTMAAAASSVLEAKDKLPMADPKRFCDCIGSLLGKTMGGSSGVLLAIMWAGMATSFEKQGREQGKQSWEAAGAKAFMDGLEAMMAAGGASTGSRTMLDALVPAAKALVDGKGFAGAKLAAEQGALATKTMAPRAGRSENVPESVWKGVEDPGAKAAALVFAELA